MWKYLKKEMREWYVHHGGCTMLWSTEQTSLQMLRGSGRTWQRKRRELWELEETKRSGGMIWWLIWKKPGRDIDKEISSKGWNSSQETTQDHVQPSWMRTTSLLAPWVSHWPGGEDISTKCWMLGGRLQWTQLISQQTAQMLLVWKYRGMRSQQLDLSCVYMLFWSLQGIQFCQRGSFDGSTAEVWGPRTRSESRWTDACRNVVLGKMEGKVSEQFEVQTGVRQGCVLSLILFNCYMDNIMREAIVSMGRGNSISYNTNCT